VVEIPAHGRGEPAREVVRGLPAELLLRARGVDRIAAVVTRAVGDEALELCVAGDARARERRVVRRGVDPLELGAQRVDDLEVRALAEAAEVVLLARLPRSSASRIPAQWSST
jgi:hypothetical protein